MKLDKTPLTAWDIEKSIRNNLDTFDSTQLALLRYLNSTPGVHLYKDWTTEISSHTGFTRHQYEPKLMDLMQRQWVLSAQLTHKVFSLAIAVSVPGTRRIKHYAKSPVDPWEVDWR